MSGVARYDAATGRAAVRRDAPFEVTRLQLRRALASAGKLAQFDAALAGSPAVAADWALAVAVRSDDPAVAAIAAAAGLDAPALREVFAAARRA